MTFHSGSTRILLRLAAVKEFAFMRALHVNNFPTPVPIDHNRHCVCMSRVHGAPMAQLRAGSLAEPDVRVHFLQSCNPHPQLQTVFRECVRWCVKLAEHGLIHCDYNEFNLMLDPATGCVTIIDFPQVGFPLT
jgi:RIO kinase 2